MQEWTPDGQFFRPERTTHQDGSGSTQTGPDILGAVQKQNVAHSETSSGDCHACHRRGCTFNPPGKRSHGAFCSDYCRQWVHRHPEDDLRRKRGCIVQRLSQVPELKRLARSAQRILGRLQKGPATGLELAQCGGGLRYGARLLELRQRGHQITAKHQGEGVWLYTLVEKSE